MSQDVNTAAVTESEATERTTPEVNAARPGLIIGIMVVTAFVMILNETTVSIALPDLMAALSVSATTVQWLISGFLVTMAVVIPTTGYLLDRFTPRAVYLTAVASFIVGTLLCAVAPGFGSLLAGRVVQACGTAVMIPLVITTVMRLVPANRRGEMMGTISIVIAVAPAIGPTVGGVILAAASWRWMFYLVLALAIVVFCGALVLLRAPFDTKQVPLSVLSVVLSAIGFAALVYGLSTISDAENAVITPWLAVVIGVVALVLFGWRQIRLQRTGSPLLNLSTLRFRRFTLSLVISTIMFMCLLGAGAVLLPIYLQNILGHSTLVAGFALLPGGLAMALVSRPVGRLYDRIGARSLLITGAIGMAAALWILALLGGSAPLAAVIGCDILLMTSLGTMMTPIMSDALGALPDRLYSHGSALLTTLQQVAGALGGAVFVTAAAMGSAAAEAPDARGFAISFGLAGLIGLVAIVVALAFPRGMVEAAT